MGGSPNSLAFPEPFPDVGSNGGDADANWKDKLKAPVKDKRIQTEVGFSLE